MKRKIYLIWAAAFTVFSTASLFAQEDFTDGIGTSPEAYWYFEEASGTRYDETANNNDLTDNNTVQQETSVVKQGAAAAKFDDDNQEYLSIAHASLSASYPLHSGATTDFTIGGWIYITKTADNADTWYEDCNDAFPNSNGIQFRDNNGKFRWIYETGGAESFILANLNYSLTTWYHIVIRWQGSTDDEFAMFLNAVKQSDTESPATIDESTSAVNFCTQVGNARYAPAILDEWFAFDEALTDTQIASIYNHGIDGGGLLKKIRKILLKIGIVLGIDMTSYRYMNPYYWR